MKTLVATVVLATVIVSPALAQTTNRQARQIPADQAFAQSWQTPERAFALQIRPGVRVNSANRANAVYDSHGDYVGSDPDPRVRLMLQIDRPGSGD